MQRCTFGSKNSAKTYQTYILRIENKTWTVRLPEEKRTSPHGANEISAKSVLRESFRRNSRLWQRVLLAAMKSLCQVKDRSRL